MPTVPDELFHRDYNCTTVPSSEAGSKCIHLQSSDGTLYCVHPDILKNSSGFFSTALSIPQRKSLRVAQPLEAEANEASEPIQMAESSDVVEFLLHAAGGRGFPSTSRRIVDVLDVLDAAEKYEMGGVVSMIRYAITSSFPPYYRSDLLETALACNRYDWKDEYRSILRSYVEIDFSTLDLCHKFRASDGVVIANVNQLQHLQVERFKQKIFKKVDDLRDTKCDRKFKSATHSGCMARRALKFLQWNWLVVEEFAAGLGFLMNKELFFSRPKVKALLEDYQCLHRKSLSRHNLDLAKHLWVSMVRSVLESVRSEITLDLDACLHHGHKAEGEICHPARSSDPGGFNTQYSCPSAGSCIHLRSSDGILYCIPTAILKNASAYFQSTIPHPPHLGGDVGDEATLEAIQLDEPTEVIEVLLGVASGKGFDTALLPTVKSVLAVLKAAERYEFKGVVTLVHSSLFSEWSPLSKRPLQLVSICYRYGWSDQYRLALRFFTIGLNVSSPEVYSELSSLDGTVVANIYQLRALRIKRFKEQLFVINDDLKDIPGDPNFNSDENSGCTARRAYQFLTWKWHVMEEFESHPSGRNLLKERVSSKTTRKSLLQPYQCHSLLADTEHEHNLDLAELTWMSALRGVLDDLAAHLDDDLDTCLGNGKQKNDD